MLANADLRGAVLEFSDTGCNISIGTQTDDAEMVPAPGAVVEEMNQVKIVYGENTYFQISHSTMTGITLEDCRKEEVKKQSMLYLYGDYQEDGTFLAKRVIIDRFEKEGEMGMNFAERAFRYLFRKKGKCELILFWVIVAYYRKQLISIYCSLYYGHPK